jgi:hypothetical protein
LLSRENEDKSKVIRIKILRYYFVAEFDASPFVKMPLSFMPTIMSQVEENEKTVCNIQIAVLHSRVV